jgi:hypothetical protein
MIDLIVITDLQAGNLHAWQRTALREIKPRATIAAALKVQG